MLRDMLLIIFVTFWTILLMYIPYIFGFRQKILDDWDTYKCNPIVLPISGWINKKEDQTETEATSINFQYCTQNIMDSYMGFLLEPLNFITYGLTELGGEMVGNIQSIRGVFDQLRTFLTDIFGGIMALFYNIIIEFLKIFISIRDLIGKIVGVVLSIAYIIDGFTLTGTSAMNGTIGDIVKATTSCFHPDTMIRKIDGTKCKISELSLGEKIEGNSEVEIIMKIKNKGSEHFYKFENEEDTIYVTGSHLIHNGNKYIPVKEHKDAILTDKINDELYCLVTSNHIIQIGDYIFHDWEDDIERYKYEYNKIVI
jgi:hypothetical protein